MNYYTYWSILDSPSSTSSSSIFLVILIISLFLFLSILKFKKSDFEKKFCLFLLSLFLILSGFGYIYLRFFLQDNIQDQKRLNELLNSSRVQKIEGTISNFERDVAYPRNGKTTTESFYIDSIKFIYSDNAMYEFSHFGGNHSRTFHNGLKVRITYIKGDKLNEIKKVEIANNQ